MPREASGAGWIRGQIALYFPIPAGTGAVEVLTDLIPAFKFYIEKVTAVVLVAATGSSASRVCNVVKDASTVVATTTYVLADGATVGAIKAFTVTPANAEFLDGSKLSVEFPTAGASAFTAGSLMLLIQYRTRPQQL